jgi:hypothetical protein
METKTHKNGATICIAVEAFVIFGTKIFGLVRIGRSTQHKERYLQGGDKIDV